MKLELDEGRVYGARYWIVRPVPGWDPTGDWGGIDTWNKMVEWCVETFGPTPKDGVFTPGCRWYAVSYTHLRAHETGRNLVCRLLLEKKNN